MRARISFTLAAAFALFAALLFGPAGTLRWPQAWIFLGLYFGLVLLNIAMLARHNPELLRERMRSRFQKGQPLWDKLIVAAVTVLILAWLPVMALDAVRFGWSRLPLWLEAAGCAGLALSMWICNRAFHANTFLAPVVRVQAERGHRVVSSGPYAVVRHPLYAGMLLMLPSAALLLGSWWGVAMSVLPIAAMVVRTLLEERELLTGLPGYREYTGRVRYRLVPGIW